MFAIEPLSLGRAYEELRSIGARASIGHGQNSRTCVLLDEILVLKFGSVDGFSSGAVSGGEIAALAHEAGDHTVEARALVVEGLPATTGPLLAGAEGAKVLGGFGGGIGKEFHDDAAGRRSANGHVEENLRVGHRKMK